MPEVSRMSKQSPFNDNIDITSINVRKFNLDICEDQNHQESNNAHSAGYMGSEIRRVCLPIFAYDILKSMNDLDINSSTSKSMGGNKIHRVISKYQQQSPVELNCNMKLRIAMNDNIPKQISDKAFYDQNLDN